MEPHNHEESSNAEFKPLGDIYALGDCSANVEGPLPALAQVIEDLHLTPEEDLVNYPLGKLL